MSQFCQATKTFIKGQEGELSPDAITNIIRFPGGTTYIPDTMWIFDDPTDPTMCYIALFKPTDLTGKTGEIHAKRSGGLVRASKDPAQSDTESFKTGCGQSVELLIIGNDGKCNGMCAFVTHDK